MYNTTIGLIGATFFIALTHAVMPNHWMPFALVGKGQKWGLTKTLLVTAIAGLGHSITTSLIGFIIAVLGFQITAHAEAIVEPLAGIVLIIIGIAFIAVGRFRQRPHSHNHAIFSDKLVVVSLLMMLSCSPCIAVLPIFLAASAYSWGMLFSLFAILTITTVSGMVVLTVLAYYGVMKINLCKVEHYEKEIIGGILTLVGIAVFLIRH